MGPDESAGAVRRLAGAVLDLRPLVDVLPPPVPAAVELDQGLLNRVAGRLGAPPFRVAPATAAGELDPFARVVSDRLGRAAVPPAVGAGCARDDLVDEVRSGSFEARHPPVELRAADGVPLRAYRAGQPREVAVVLAPACGMPARLCAPWLRHLARDHFVLTYETRGLFGRGLASFDGATDVPAQATDLVAVLDHFGVRRAHLIGFCGGAVIALAAAGSRPERVSSLSLWHGDFQLGPGGPRTDHQRDLQALLAMAVRGQITPEAMHSVITKAMLRTAPPGLAHLVLYPYATPRLLSRYCRLNGSIMETDVRGYLTGPAPWPVLVVTSQDDATADPDGSRRVAAALGARLHVRPHGDHLSLFEARTELPELAASFIARADP